MKTDLFYLRRHRAKAGSIEHLDFADRWLRDGLSIAEIPGGIGSLEVDVSAAAPWLEKLKAAGLPPSYSPLFVKAASIALTRLPHLHVMAAGNRRYYPEHIDIGISVAGETFLAPVMLLEHAEQKSVIDLGREIALRQAEIRAADRRLLNALRRWGWIVPFSVLRRGLLRLLRLQFGFRRQGSGTFQMTQLPNVDWVIPLRISTAAVLGIGSIRDRVISVDGQPSVRPTVIITCVIDHSSWDGMCMARFLKEFKDIIESGEYE